MGYPDANVVLSKLYDGTRQGFPADPAKRLALLGALAEKGEAAAQYQLFILYGLGRPGDLPKNPSLALKWLRSSAEQGDPDAQRDLAQVYRHYAAEFGLPTDNVKARQWAELASAQGSSQAQMTLYFIYKMGSGVPRNLDRARTYLEDAQ